MKNNNLLKFSKGNAKLNKNIYSISLPSGFSCPMAEKCLTKADRVTGKLSFGKKIEFRCFSATQENIFTKTRAQRWHNFDLLKQKSTKQMAGLIQDSMPKNANIIRLHVAGDFFSQEYFNAWVTVAKNNPNIIFYAYTKSLQFWINQLMSDNIPSNFKLNASKGGKMDFLIDVYKLKYVQVVLHTSEAEKLGLELDHDDSNAYAQDKSFAILIHGTQAPGSPASKALSENRKNGIGGYGRNNKNYNGKTKKINNRK